jgi:hypothetical protein
MRASRTRADETPHAVGSGDSETQGQQSEYVEKAVETYEKTE